MQLEAQLRFCQSCLWCYKSGVRLLSNASTNRTAVTHYELLGVKSTASMNEIKNAFFEKSKKLHPDSDPSNPALHSRFVELNEAYRVLSKESSRKEYDFKCRHPSSRGQTFRSTSGYTSSTGSRASADAQDHRRYWEQFHPAQEMTAEEWQRRRRRNHRMVGYCIIAMVMGIGVQLLLFRKLAEIHTNFMDEKDRILTEVYNETRERARVNGFKKQMEIMVQKQAEFQEKYKPSEGGKEKRDAAAHPRSSDVMPPLTLAPQM
ncbi:dnaJ homolog subfamily C member 4 [Diretmus argenteus]